MTQGEKLRIELGPAQWQKRGGLWVAGLILQIPVHRGQSFQSIADSVPVIADKFLKIV
jgi:hypothetical protein